MAKVPNWNRKLSEVLGYQTQTVVKKSEKTGNTYNAEVIPRIELVCMGAPEEVVKKDAPTAYRYTMFDMKKNLTYSVKCPNLLQISGAKQVILTNLTGGALSNGRGWYKADSIALAPRK